MKKRCTAMIICIIMTMLMLPVTAFADEGDKAIMAGADGVQANDKVYFGKYTKYGMDYDIPWIVLSSTALSETSVASGTNALPLLSEYLLGDSLFRADSDWGYYNFETANNTADSSILKETLEGYYNGANALFGAAEQNAVADTKLTGSSMYAGQAALSGQKLFPLSYSEAENLTWGSPILQTKYRHDGSSDYWWLRSSNDYADTYCVDEEGLEDWILVDNNNGVRPAFHLDMSKVLFTSAADNCGQNSTFAVPVPYSGRDWKLTLKDGNDFGIGASIPANSLTLMEGYAPYLYGIEHAALSSFAGAGYTNVTAALTNASGEILYYGSINADTDATISTVTIPSGLAAGAYTLSVYAEDRNAANTTDYASGTPFTQTIIVTRLVPPTVTVPTADRNIPVTVGSPVTFSVTADNANSYQWWINRGDGSGFVSVTGALSEEYYIHSVTADDIGDRLYCEVSGRGGSVKSPVFTLIAPAPSNIAPTASAVCITGTPEVGKLLTGSYTYVDADGDIEETSIFQWYRADNASGLNKTAIPGANNKTYTLTSADIGKYISFEVTPVAQTGITRGDAVESASICVNVPDPIDNLRITRHPANVNAYVGEMAAFTVEAAGGTTPYHYQWQVGRGDDFENISGATNASYTISAVAMGNDGCKYRCTVSDSAGTIVTSNTATLSVYENTEIPKTGDDSRPALWLGLMMLSLGCLIVPVIIRKRRNV